MNVAPKADDYGVDAGTSRSAAADVALAPLRAESSPSRSPQVTSSLSVAGRSAQIDHQSEGQAYEMLLSTNKNNADRVRWAAKMDLEERNREFEQYRDSYSKRLSLYKLRYASGPGDTLSRFHRNNLLAGRRATKTLIEAEQAYSEAATLARPIGAPDYGQSSRFGDDDGDEGILRQEEDDQIRHTDLTGVERWLNDMHPPLRDMDHDDDSRMSAASFGDLGDAPFARTLSDIAQGHHARKIDRHHSRMRKAWLGHGRT